MLLNRIEVGPDKSMFNIGYQAENEVTLVAFDVQDWLAACNGQVQLVVQRDVDSEPYAVPVRIAEGYAEWLITETDTACRKGKAQLLYHCDNKVAKKKIYTFQVNASLGPSRAERPPWDSWFNTILQAGSDAQRAAVDAENASMAIQNMRVDAKDGAHGSANVQKEVDADGVVTLHFTIPAGLTGSTPEIKIRTVSRLPANSTPTIVRVPGSPNEAPVFDIGIPEGQPYIHSEEFQALSEQVRNDAKASGRNAATASEEARKSNASAQAALMAEGNAMQHAEQTQTDAQITTANVVHSNQLASQVENNKNIVEQKTKDAQRAALDAENASMDIQNMGVDAKTTPPGSSAAVNKEVTGTGSVTLHFSIPAGLTGSTPAIKIRTVSKLPSGSTPTIVRVPGSPDEAPVFDIGIPEGEPYVHSEEFSTLADQVRQDAEQSGLNAQSARNSAGDALRSAEAAVRSEEAAGGFAQATETNKTVAETAAANAGTSAGAAAEHEKTALSAAERAEQAAQQMGNIIDDAVIVTDKTWSSLNIIKQTTDRLAPPFRQKGPVVQGELVADYPMGVKSYIESPNGVNEIKLVKCGKNLINFPEVEFEKIEIVSSVFDLPAGTYSISAVFNNDNPSYDGGLIFFLDNQGKAITNALIKKGARNGSEVKLTRAAYGLSFYATGSGATNPGVKASYSDIQVEVGSAFTDYDPYNGETYTVALGESVQSGVYEWDTGLITITAPVQKTKHLAPQTLLAVQGITTIYGDTAETEVIARKDPNAEREAMEKRIAALESAALKR